MDKDVAVWIIKDNNRLKKSDKEKDSYFKILKIENKKVELLVKRFKKCHKKAEKLLDFSASFYSIKYEMF